MSIEYALRDISGNEIALNDATIRQPVRGSLSYRSDEFAFDNEIIESSALDGAKKIGETRLASRTIVLEFSRAQIDEFDLDENTLIEFLIRATLLVDKTHSQSMAIAVSNYRLGYDEGGHKLSSDNEIELTCLEPFWSSLILSKHRLSTDEFFNQTENIVTDPEDLTTVNWSDFGTASEQLVSLYNPNGKQYTKITAGAATSGRRGLVIFTSSASKVFQGWVRRGDETGNTYLGIYDSDASVWRGQLQINWTTKAITIGSGTILETIWNGNDEVWVSALATGGIIHTNNNYVMCIVNTNGKYAHFTAIQVEDVSTFSSFYIDPIKYPTQVRPAHDEIIALTMPNKFIFKIKIRPYFYFNTATNQIFASWYIDGSHRLIIFFATGGDKIGLYWINGGTGRYIQTEQFDNGVSYDNINSEIILFGSIDLTTQTGNNRLFAIVAGSKQIEDTSWDGVLDAFSSFLTFTIGSENHLNYAHSLIHSLELWNWDGVNPGTLDDEADIDTYLAKNNEKIFSFQNIQILNTGFRKSPPLITLTANAAVTSFQIYVDETKEGIQIDDSIFGTPGYLTMIIDCENGTVMIGSLDRSESILPGTGYFSIPVGLSTLKLVVTGGNVIMDVQLKTRRHI